jgi:cytochrome c-type protein NapB
MADHPSRKSKHAGFIAGGIIVLVAISGYFVGLRQTTSAISLTRPVEVIREASRRDLTGAVDVPPAVRYLDQDWTAAGRNRDWRTTLSGVPRASAAADPSVVAPVPVEARRAALQARAGRRAFDGAPPMVPHPVVQDSSAACLACHSEGLAVKDRFASKMSHPPLGGSCTQCHVSSQGAFRAMEAAVLAAPLADNSFQGLEAPVGGPRAWPGAPPTIPHRTLMRSDCMSCHGPHGLHALRTPHPDRQSCTQCHVPAAAADQRQFLSVLPLDAPRPEAGRPGSPAGETVPSPAVTPAPSEPPSSPSPEPAPPQAEPAPTPSES